MDDRQWQQLGIAAVAIIVGLSGWLLPYKWNLLRLKRGLAARFSQRTNERIPKIIGGVLLAVGIVVLVVTLAGGNLK